MRALRWMSVMLLFPAVAQGQIEYHVAWADANASDVSAKVRVRMECDECATGPREFIMPRAIPMGYGQQPYDQFVSNVKAFGKTGEPIRIERADGPRWKLWPGTRRIEYEVDLAQMENAISSGGDASRARPGYIFLLGYSVFGYVEGMEDRPIELHLTAPANRKEWPIFSTLAPAIPAAPGKMSAKAANFHALADSQMLAGPKLIARRLKGSVPAYLALYAESEMDVDATATLASEAIAALTAYFGEVPFMRYAVVLEMLRPISPRHTYNFSMEHLDSLTACMSAERAITAKSSERDKSSLRFAIAHHVAHAWIPKRAYGEGYFPFRWELAPLIDTIWFAEGFGQYAAIDALADVLPEKEGSAYRERMVEMRFRSTLREMPAFLKQMPLMELSKLASTMYSEDFRVGRTTFSRGGMMAYEMDQKIRAETKGEKRLRDVLRGLVAWSAREQRAFRIEELAGIFNEATGVETKEILDKWLKPMRD